MSVNTIVCIPDLVIIKYFGNNTIEIKRIVFTYPDLLPSALIVSPKVVRVITRGFVREKATGNKFVNIKTHSHKLI